MVMMVNRGMENGEEKETLVKVKSSFDDVSGFVVVESESM